MREGKQSEIQSFAFVLSICAAFCFCGSFVCGYVNGGGKCEIELESRVNPNDAPLESLIRLPGIGVSRARAIIEYREEFGGGEGGNKVFHNCNDLQKVRGIGPKTAQKISEWVKFE
jgi:competence ComEA-like helix-hairpin-helix protein